MTFFPMVLPKILVAGALVLFIIFAPISLFNKIYVLNYSVNKQYKFDFSGVLTLWNVDTFEGGSVSRTAFFEKRAIEFEKENKGVYLSVQNLSLEQLKMNLESGKKPNIITFGIGVGQEIKDEIIELNLETSKVRDDLLVSGKLDGKLKAVPIILGGYSLILNKEKLSGEDIVETLKTNNSKIIFSSQDLINPLLPLVLKDVNLSNQEIENVDSYDAYDKFINEKYNAIVGTQRDLFRCKNRENNLKMQCEYNFLGGFSDLIQYASIFPCEENALNMSKKFVEYVISEKVQEKLEHINMYPVINKNIYTDDFYNKFNQNLLKPLKTLNAFLSTDKIENLKELSKDFVFLGKTANKSEILKYING